MKSAHQFFLIAVTLIAMLGCVLAPGTVAPTPIAPTETPVAPPSPTPQPTAGIANPASQFCADEGGQVEIRTAADGSQAGYCLFADGSECEEWAFFRGECAPGGAAVPPATAVPTDTLVATVLASLPTGAFGGVNVQATTVPAGWAPVWIVSSYGMRNYDLDPAPSHFVAIYTTDGANWQQLAWLNLDEADPTGAVFGPDYLNLGDVRQVQVEPSHVWIEVPGGVGAHGGVYQLLMFDGSTLTAPVNASAASPGLGSLADLNGDGIPEVVLDQSDAYVFCYACGVRKIAFVVYIWNAPNQQLQQAIIDYYYMGQPQPMRDVLNPAVEMANAGLWKDALPQVTQARDLLPDYPEADPWALAWDYALIKLHADAMAADVATSPYPLLSNVFYGDYTAAVDPMRSYSPDQILNNTTSPLIVGTVAEGWQDALSGYIVESANAALAVKPDLAPAYFLRGWAEYLADSTSAQARADVQQAAALAPDDPLFAQCAAFLP